MDENEKRNEIAATLFSVLIGMALLLLLGWLFGRGCSSAGGDAPVAGDPGAATPAYVAADGENPNDQDSGSDEVSPETPSETSTTDPEVEVDSVKVDDSNIERRLELAAEKRALEEELADLKARHKEEFDRVAGERDALKLNTDKKIDELEGTSASLKTKIDELDGSLETANKAKSELQKKLDAALKAQKDLEAKNASQGKLADKVAALTREKGDLSKKLAAANAASVAAKTAMGAGKTDLQKAEANNANFKKRISELESKIEGLGKEKINFTKAIEKLKADATAAAKKMTASANDSDGKIKKLTADNKTFSAEIATLKAAAAKMGDTSAQVKKLSDQNAAFSAEIEKLKTAAIKMGDDSSARIKTLTAEKKALAAEVANLKAVKKKGEVK